MAQYKVEIPLDYVMGYLKYGHLEGYVCADSYEEAYEKAREEAPYMELVVDEYEVNDIGDADLNSIDIYEI